MAITVALAIASLAVQLRPMSRRSQPPLQAGSWARPVHRWDAGTPAITCLTCWPQPAQVVFAAFLAGWADLAAGYVLVYMLRPWTVLSFLRADWEF
jgi:hypothetical protein